jgi:Histidine kinase-, DNA gyrase B-, and HSP90-like ATPase
MSNKEETIKLKIPKSFTFGDFTGDDFDGVLGFFDWSLKDKKIEFDNSESIAKKESFVVLYYLYEEYLFSNNCRIWVRDKSDKVFERLPVARISNAKNFNEQISSNPKLLETNIFPILVVNSEDRQQYIELGEKYIESFGIEYVKTLRYVLNEILSNTFDHGRNGHSVFSMLQFCWNELDQEISFIVADTGVGIKKHLRQTYPHLSNDVDAILHAIKPKVSGTFGKMTSNYGKINNAGVGLYFSSNLAQRLNADMFIVSGNGFVHISPTEIIQKELRNKWKGTFVYVKIKLGLLETLSFEGMRLEIEEKIPKNDPSSEVENYYINLKNYFGIGIENKDLAKKIRDEKLLPALDKNRTLTIDFEDVVFATDSVLNAMLATPINRLGLPAYKRIKVINAASDIRVMLDFIFDDNTSNA